MDGLGSFNVAPPSGQVLYAPHPDATNVPEYTSQVMPPPVSYMPAASPAAANLSPITPTPIPHPPSFQQVLASAEQHKGSQLTKDEYDALVGEYRTRVAVPILNHQHGAKKAAVDADLAAFDDAANKLRQQRYVNSAQEQESTGGLGGFLKAAGTEAFGSLVPGTAAFASRLAGGITSLAGQAPNKVSDWFLTQSDPNVQNDGLTDQQAGEASARMLMGRNYGNPAYAKLQQDIINQAAAKHSALNSRGIGGTSVGGYEQKIADYAGNKSELGKTAGDIASLLTIFLGNDAAASKIGSLGKIAEDASALQKLGRYLPAASLTATRTSSDTATQNVQRGDKLSNILGQEAADQLLGTIFNLLPAHMRGGKLVRGLTGAAAGAGEYAAQQAVDKQLNNSNEGASLKGLLTSAGFQAALALLLGGRGAAGLRAGRPEATPSAPEATPEAAAAADRAQPTSTPIDGYKLMLADAPENGVQDAEFYPLQTRVLEEANKQAKKYKIALLHANTPERVVTSAWKMAQKFSGDAWNRLSADQRNQLIETLSTWVGRKSNVSAEDIASHLESLRNPAPEDLSVTTGQAPVTEQPLPSDITGQQVPGTVAQEPPVDPAQLREQAGQHYAAANEAAKAGDTAAQAEHIKQAAALVDQAQTIEEANKNSPNPKSTYVDPIYQKLWNELNNGVSPDPTIAASSLYKQLLPAVKAGKINSAEKLQDVILQAQELAAKRNKLKNKSTKPTIQASTEPVVATAPKSTPKPTLKKIKTAPTAQDGHEAVAETVTQALSEESTPDTQRDKLKKAVRDKTEKKYNQAYLHALINRDNPASSPEEVAIRQDGAFNAAADAMRQGKISNADELGLFLKEQAGTATIGDQSNALGDTTRKQQIGALLSSRSTKNNTVAAKRYVRESVLNPLIKLGEKESDIRKMTVEQAEKHLQRLADTFTNTEPEPTPPKPKGGKLKSKKQKKAAAPPKPKAPEQTTGASEKNSLETELYSRFNDKIPSDDLDKLHDAILEASDTGDKLALNQHIKDLQESGYIDSNDALKIRYLANKLGKSDSEMHNDVPRDKQISNNASGESAASLEAQHRLADEKAAGQSRMLIDRDGSVHPLEGVDAVDTHARRGQVIVQRGIGREPWTVLSHGDDLSPDIARGKVNRARDELDNYKNTDTPERFGEHTLNVEDVEEYAQLRDKSGEHTIDKRTPLNVTHRVGKIIEKIQDGVETREIGNELLRLHDDLNKRNLLNALDRLSKERRRGPEWFKARLAREIADHLPGSRQRYAMEFADWLLQSNPHLVDDIALSIRNLTDKAGTYNPVARLISIHSMGTNATTVVHEILHASETMMPDEVQEGIRGEYVGRLLNKLKQQKNNPVAREYLQTAITNFMHPSKELRDKLYTLLKKNTKELPVSDFYKYFSPSEYWAEEGSAILQRRYNADSWTGKAKNWLTEFIQHIKNLLGLDSNSKILKGLKTVMHADAGPEPVGMLDNVATEYRDVAENSDESNANENLGYEPAPDANEDPNLQSAPKYNKDPIKLQEVTTAQKAIETTARADYALEKAMQLARSKGIEINEHNNVEDAAFAKNGLVSEYNNKDWYEAAEPVDNWMTVNVNRFAKNKQDLFDKLNKFFQNTHWLERVKTDWAIESPLSPDAEIDRAELMDQVQNNAIDPSEASKKLYALAEKSSVYTWEEWADKNSVPLESIQKQLDILDKESGVNKQSMSELNMLLDAPRKRITDRLIEAGLVDKNDPYIKLYNWKWYVPLKGSAYGGAPDNNFDLIPARRLSLGKLNQQMKAMEGRKSYAERPFSRLFVDMARAGERHANSHVLNALYNLVIDHGKEFGAEIETFTGRPKDGYTNVKTQKFVNVLKAPAHGVIINDGDTHYVVTLPPDSQLLRGLIQMNNVERPSKLDRFVGRGTNVLARLYTTVHPGWQTFSGFVRDLTYVPFTMAATRFDNPLDAVPFFSKYYVNVFKAYRALPTLLPHIFADNPKARKVLGLKTVREMGEANPDSWAGWIRRYEEAGGSNQFTKGFDVPGAERLFQSHLKDVDGVLDATKWTWQQVLEYTGNYANFLESISRVAGFRTLIGEGFSPRDAAVQVRKTLDYSQSGIKGRKINSWLAFFRVGMTGADAMRRAFTKETGGFDYAKFAKWQGFFGALGAVGYMMGAALLGQDEDGKDRIAKIEPDTLTQKMLFPIGDKIAGVNLGLGLPQVLMAPGILSAAVSMGHMDKSRAIEAYWKMLLRNGPVSPAGRSDSEPTSFAKAFIVGFTPTVVRPIVDVGTNVNSFDNPIHSRINDNNKYHTDQARSTTPKEFTEMATWLREATDNKIDMYPEDIRYLVQNYGGQWATDFVKTALSDPNAQAGAGPEPNRLAGKLFVDDAKHYMNRELYDTLDNLNDSQRRYNSLVAAAKRDGATDQEAKAKADQTVSRDPTFRKELAAYKTLDAARRDYQSKIKTLRSNRLISDTRKQLERKRLDSVMRQAIEKAQAVLGQ